MQVEQSPTYSPFFPLLMPFYPFPLPALAVLPSKLLCPKPASPLSSEAPVPHGSLVTLCAIIS